MSENELEAILTRWVSQYSDSLLRICFVQLTDWAMAEDALQETFIKAWKALPRYLSSPERNDKAWLSTIAINVCRDMSRRRTRWLHHVDPTRAIDDLPPALVSVQPEDRTLMMDICALPEKHRQVLMLYYYQHLTMREVGKVLHIDVSTVYNRLKKAETLLKRQLTEEVDAP